MAEASEQSAYKTLVQTLRAQIESGQLGIDETLPSTAELTSQYGVSTTVVKNAVRELKATGYAYSRQGKGVYARLPDPPEWLAPLLIAGSRLAEVASAQGSAAAHSEIVSKWQAAVERVPERFRRAVEQRV
jgi:DNA-binding GntR family transcriptional regulator